MRILDINRSFACFDKKVFLKTSCLTHWHWQILPLSVAERGNNQFNSHSHVREKYLELEQKNNLCEWRKIIFCTEINPGQASRVLGNNEEEI